MRDERNEQDFLEDWGEVEVKNIARPIRVFRVLSDAQDAGKRQRAAGIDAADLGVRVGRAQDRGLRQAEAGKILGIKQPHVSALMRNRAGNFSVARLMNFLTALDQDVEITVRPKRRRHGEMSLVVK